MTFEQYQDYVNNYIATNGRNAITGNVMNVILQEIGEIMFQVESKFTIELVEAQTIDFYAPYAMQINSITNILNAPVITIQDDGAAYILGNIIAAGSKITVESDIESVVTLNVTKP
jgi:hypothetical protein